MLQVSISEFKADVGKYIDMAAEDDVCIMQDGKPAVKLTRPDSERVAAALHQAQVAFAGVADAIGVSNEDDVQALVDEVRYGKAAADID